MIPATEPSTQTQADVDPRAALASWANRSDEWLRYIARQVIATGRPLPESDIGYAYRLFRQEKLIDERDLPVEEQLAAAAGEREVEEPLAITKISDVYGVNALTPGAVIEPHAGMTVLYGENGTGKTGYARILKALANSRTADAILGDITALAAVEKSAAITYTLGDEERTVTWTGESGLSPFTRMAIFDSPAVNIHLDADLEYVYVPSVLSLFNHVSTAIQAVQHRLDQDIRTLTHATPDLLARFPRGSSIYPQIETLGEATNLEALRALAAFGDEPRAKLKQLTQGVAALESNAAGAQLPSLRRLSAVLQEAETALKAVSAFDLATYNEQVGKLAGLRKDQAALREALFAAASLPATPDDTWSQFVASGETYRRHLVDEGVHDDTRCLYCRQPLSEQAVDLVNRYGEYLADRLGADIRAAERTLASGRASVSSIVGPGIISFLSEQEPLEERSPHFDLVTKASTLCTQFQAAAANDGPIEPEPYKDVAARRVEVGQARGLSDRQVAEMEERQRNREQKLTEARANRAELEGRVELALVWSEVEAKVQDSRLATRIRKLVGKVPNYLRQVTALAKSASDQLINQSFDDLFAEECKHLRAPALEVQFVGREGRPQRRRTLGKSYKPSKILSEGEQKVLAIADFLAEARLTGITAPITSTTQYQASITAASTKWPSVSRYSRTQIRSSYLLMTSYSRPNCSHCSRSLRDASITQLTMRAAKGMWCLRPDRVSTRLALYEAGST